MCADDWIAARVLPDIALTCPIEGGYTALVPPEDARVRTLGRAHPNLRSFLRRFRDAFGEKLEPAVLLIKADAPEGIHSSEALAGFRDAIAIATVAWHNARELRSPRGLSINFTDAFGIYPWMLDRYYEDLIASTPAMLGTHEVPAFNGQSAPGHCRQSLGPGDTDGYMLEALLARWRRRFAAARPAWADVALFRSLNMANAAARMPAGSDTNIYDVGRAVALWISAFEILVHPGGNGRSGLAHVYRLLESVAWQKRQLRARRFKAYGRHNDPRRPFACQLYGWLYNARHEFLHGNPVNRRTLLPGPSGRPVTHFAAPLYRMALTGFLPLVPVSAEEGSVPDGERIARIIDMQSAQRAVEDGLLVARRPPAVSSRRRQLPPRRGASSSGS